MVRKLTAKEQRQKEAEQREWGLRLVKARKAAGLTQVQLAEKLGLTDKSIQNWEQGINPPASTHIRPLIEILGTSFGWLELGEGTPVVDMGGTPSESKGGVSYLEFRRWRSHADEELAAMRDEIAALRAEVGRKASRPTSKKSQSS